MKRILAGAVLGLAAASSWAAQTLNVILFPGGANWTLWVAHEMRTRSPAPIRSGALRPVAFASAVRPPARPAYAASVTRYPRNGRPWPGAYPAAAFRTRVTSSDMALGYPPGKLANPGVAATAAGTGKP